MKLNAEAGVEKLNACVACVPVKLSVVVLTLALGMSGNVGAATFSGDDYTAERLLSPCQEADNDARWGEAAETECEQYLLGLSTPWTPWVRPVAVQAFARQPSTRPMKCVGPSCAGSTLTSV